MSKSMLKSVHRRAVGISDKDQLMAPFGVTVGGDGKPTIDYPSPGRVAIYEDFHGVAVTGDDTGKPLYGGPFKALIGDTGHTSTEQAGTNGVFRLLSARSTTTDTPAEGVGIGTGVLGWKGNQGPGSQSGDLRFAARVKMLTAEKTEATGSNRIHVFAGFTDIAAFEYPAYDTGAGVVSNAADYMGVMFSPGGDTGWSGVAGKSTAGDSGDQVVSLDTGVAANTYDVVELHYHRGVSDTGGTVSFYINGQPKGSISSPVVPTTALAPGVWTFAQDTGDNHVDVDWIAVSAPRDTGL